MPESRMPLIQRNDHPAMREAATWCQSSRLEVRRVSIFQLKYGLINFYPQTGTIHIDELGTVPESGLLVFQSLVAKPHRSLRQITEICEELKLLPESSQIILL